MVASRTVERGLGWFLLVVGGLDVLIAVFLLVVYVSRGERGYAFGALAWVGISVGAVVAGRRLLNK